MQTTVRDYPSQNFTNGKNKDRTVHPATHRHRSKTGLALDLIEREKDIVILCDVPGVSRDDISLEMNENVLTITSERRNTSGDTDHNDPRYGRKERRLRFAVSVSVDDISASLKNGVLRVTLPKKDASQPKRITVHAG